MLGIVYKNPHSMIELIGYADKLQINNDNISFIIKSFLDFYTIVCHDDYDVKNIVSKLDNIQYCILSMFLLFIYYLSIIYLLFIH